MRTILLLVLKDFRLWINDRTGMALSFLVPTALILVFGMVLGGGGGGTPSGIRILVVDEAANASSQQLVEALERESAFRIIQQRSTESGQIDLSEDDVRGMLETNASSYRYGIIIPPDFVSDGIGFRIKMLYNPQSPMEAAMVNGLFQRAFFTSLPQLFTGRLRTSLEELLGSEGWQLFRDQVGEFGSTVFGVDPSDSIAGFDELVGELDSGESLFAGEPGGGGDLLSSILEVEDEQIFGRGRNMATQSIAGFAAMFLLFGLSAAANSLFEDRSQQILHRLLAGPVTKLQILAAKYLFSLIMGVIQLAFLFAVGHLMFDVINSPAQLPLLVLMMIALSGAATGFGMILCAYARTAAQASGLATLIILTMSALGGAMIPSFLFPAFLRDYITPLTLVHWGVDGFLAILWRDATLLGILPYLGILSLFAAATLAIATPRFLKESTFSR